MKERERKLDNNIEEEFEVFEDDAVEMPKAKENEEFVIPDEYVINAESVAQSEEVTEEPIYEEEKKLDEDLVIEKKREPTERRKPKKKIVIICAAIIILIIAGVVTWLILSNNKKEEDNKGSSNNPNQSENDIGNKVKDVTEKKQGYLEFSNMKISSSGSNNIISGTVKNTGDNASKQIEVRLKNKDNGRTYGTSKTTIDINKNEEKEFELTIMGDYSLVDTFEVVVLD